MAGIDAQPPNGGLLADCHQLRIRSVATEVSGERRPAGSMPTRQTSTSVETATSPARSRACGPPSSRTRESRDRRAGHLKLEPAAIWAWPRAVAACCHPRSGNDRTRLAQPRPCREVAAPQENQPADSAE